MADGSPRVTEKQRWALPGSGHDRIVRWSKVALPAAVGVLVAILALAPLDKHGEVSFILDKKKVDSAQEHMRLESAHYVGTDDKGQNFLITANRALQRSANVPLVDIEGVSAKLALQNGPVTIAANSGQYDLDRQKVAIPGQVKVTGPDGYRLGTQAVNVDMKQRQLTSTGPVAGEMRLGRFQAGHLHADLASRTVVLDGGARLKIVQGAVR
ncbi:LPS export ABC transporter periplasmic protein LptC [Sphingomonas sp.]|uniref:LPS export ABC transporter periplasmic protein LptC n=1 Tax=Sphingomonas sp. TaxID=28214 RepID=UPI0025F2D1E1|nr:LPS export ABC transporter periplasmic protein LptC [Sphingomonas sp.]MBV9529307.1 LPS export ABC transporter periplasmic protein LptC [Sphingomonas sp.]